MYLPRLFLVASTREPRSHEGGTRNGALRLCPVQVGSELDVLPATEHMPETSTSTPGSHATKGAVAETVVVLTIKHKNKLPADLLEKITKRVYDIAAIHGEQPDVTAKEWYAIQVREA